MKLEAVVHPTSISYHDKQFNPDIHIASEVLDSETFRRKMINIPVTAYHHDTMKAVELIEKKNIKLTANSMRWALSELNKNLPTPQQLAKELLKKQGKKATPENIWKILPSVSEQAGGPGVLGKVTRYWREGDKWLVEIFLDKITAFQKKLIKKGGALGEISLTHAVLDGVIEPLEVSFTIQGLRTGSTINRIVSASNKSYQTKKMSDVTIIAENTETPADIETIPAPENEETCPIRELHSRLNESDQQLFIKTIQEVKRCSAAQNKVNETRLAELEKGFGLVQTSVANALSEMGPAFGNIPQRTPEEWTKDPASLGTANQFIMAAAVNNWNKRKRENEELDKALEDIMPANSSSRIVSASSRPKTKDTPAEDEFFKELRNMRNALKNMN